MAILISDIKIELSGGSTNVTPVLSLGGVKSTLAGGEVLSQNAAASVTGNVTGVTFHNAYANALGNGTLKWNQVTGYLTWKPFGGVQDNGVIITGDGRYVLGDSSGFLLVDVTQASLPVSTQQDIDITVSNLQNNVFDSVSALESTDGLIEYRCLYVHNTHGVDTAFDVRVWVKEQPIGPDELDVALDPAGKGNGSTTGVAIGPLADEEDSGSLLNAIVWTRPSTQATGLSLGNLAPGEVYAFWEKRTVSPETTQQVSNDVSKIGLSALI